MNIVVTGSSKGIGAEIVRFLLTKTKHNVIGIARDGDRLEKLKNAISEEAQKRFSYVASDIGNISNVKYSAEQIRNRFAQLDILINNAGFLVNVPFANCQVNDFDKMYDVNIKAPFFLTQCLLDVFARPSHILNITSMGGVQGSAKFAGLAGYSSSKAALTCLTECLAEELKSLDIRVNAVALGAVQTEMLQAAFPGYEAPVTPEEIAGFIADIACNGHKLMNGKIIPLSLSVP